MLALAAYYLAAKVEERGILLDILIGINLDLINKLLPNLPEFYKNLKRLGYNLNLSTQWKSTVRQYEEMLLKVNGVNLQIRHPYNSLINVIEYIWQNNSSQIKITDIISIGWGLLNDSYVIRLRIRIVCLD